MEHFIKKYKIIVAYIHDLIAVFLAFIFSYLLRFNFDIPYEYAKQIWYVLPYLIIPQSIIFIYIEKTFHNLAQLNFRPSCHEQNSLRNQFLLIYSPEA